MKFTRRQPDREIPIHRRAGDALHMEPAPRPDVLINGLLQSEYVAAVKTWVTLPEHQLDALKKEAILNSWWIGRLDPAYAQQLAALPWLKDFAYTHLQSLYSRTHEMFLPTVTEESDHLELDRIDYICKAEALENVIPILNQFPTVRQELRLGSPGSDLFPLSSFQRVVQQVKNIETSFERKVVKAVELVAVWPDKRQEIIDTVLGPDNPGLKKVEQALSLNSYYADYALGMLLLLFPDWRSKARDNISATTEQILKNRRAISAESPERRTNLYLLSAWPVMILAADNAWIDESGRIQLELKQPTPVNTAPLPDRPFA